MAANTRFVTAIHALVILALEPGSLATSDDVADALKTNPVVIRRVFSHLRQAGLIESHKGPNGGSRLARPPKEITLAAIYRAVESEPLLTATLSSSGTGNKAGNKLAGTLEEVFRRTQRAVEKELEETTLNDLAKRMARKAK
ncbi:Rrf2 family transcriptional regulator [Acidipila rosea]|uniref:BadM/Rrf2 family transcriptional regulator n=1 Tax=Acidipila rosea TaxID=768535 RepID=A0A4R1LB54_9BACT|nr:Rrf2 family transcriptional regulator [Acidipila rosea]TCK75708.1 BadM/Rrf2 family transcriptional regulator [Acidipila rosea]